MEILLIAYLLLMTAVLVRIAFASRDVYGAVGALWLAMTVALPALYLIVV